VVYLKTCVERRQCYLKLIWIQLPDFTKCVTTDAFCALVWPQPYGLFNNPVNRVDHIAPNDRMISELLFGNIRVYIKGNGFCLFVGTIFRIVLEGTRNPINILNHDNRSPNRNLNPGPPECEAGILTITLRCSRKAITKKKKKNGGGPTRLYDENYRIIALNCIKSPCLLVCYRVCWQTSGLVAVTNKSG
jgi:hypothetical protein